MAEPAEALGQDMSERGGVRSRSVNATPERLGANVSPAHEAAPCARSTTAQVPHPMRAASASGVRP
jgi:hypothetical protein